MPDFVGSWRMGTKQFLSSDISGHPDGGFYDIVHWRDFDDASYTLYFKKGTTQLCFRGGE